MKDKIINKTGMLAIATVIVANFAIASYLSRIRKFVHHKRYQ